MSVPMRMRFEGRYGVRLVVVALCVLAMIDLQCEVVRTVAPTILVAVDDSESTHYGATFDPDALVLSLRKLGVNDVRVRKLSHDEPNASPLGDFLIDLGDEFVGNIEPPSLTVFVSDGIVTHGTSLDAVSLASPVVCVVVGSDVAPADIAWETPLILRDNADGNATWQVIAQLRATGQRAEREVVLKLDCVGDVVATKRITIPAGDSQHSWTFTIPEHEASTTFLAIEFDNAVDDIVANNRIQLDLPRERRAIRTLLIDSTPRPEYRFIRETLRRLDECELQTVLLGTDDLTAELAASSDLVIVGDVDLDSLPNEVAAAIKSRPRVLVAGVETATGAETSPFEVRLTDDPLVPTLQEPERFDVRWSVVPSDAAPESRILATAGGRPLIVLDEDRRICFHATDELYRATGVWGVAWWRDYWRRLVVFLGEAGRREDARYGRATGHAEFQNLKRDTAALNSLATQNDGFVIDATSITPDGVAEAIVNRLTFDQRVRVPLIPSWCLFAAAIAVLFATWWREHAASP
ncbi:MAG: hypothetical protein ACRC46_05025 [Thermoguttaceae bacterium]